MIHDNVEFDLYFIRHGESQSNVTPGIAAGANFDAPMTDRGHLQAEAAADVAKVTSAEPMFEASKGTYFKDGKGSWTDQTAGAVKDALLETFVTDKKPDLPSYEAQLDGEFDKRVIEMRELANKIASGEYTGNNLKLAQDRIKYLNSVMGVTGGAETFFEYLKLYSRASKQP